MGGGTKAFWGREKKKKGREVLRDCDGKCWFYQALEWETNLQMEKSTEDFK